MVGETEDVILGIVVDAQGGSKLRSYSFRNSAGKDQNI